MNVTVGIATALAMWLTGVGDPILWGNFIFFKSLQLFNTRHGFRLNDLSFGWPPDPCLYASAKGIIPAGLYFGFHLIEGETLTPMLLARRFTLNPVLVIISLVFGFLDVGYSGGRNNLYAHAGDY